MDKYYVGMKIRRGIFKSRRQTPRVNNSSSFYKEYYINFSPVLLNCIPRKIWKLRALPRDKYVSWVGTKKPTETSVHVAHAIIIIW